MRRKQTLVINGKVYDAVTGLPVAMPDSVEAPLTPSVSSNDMPALHKPNAPLTPSSRQPHHAKKVHGSTKKSSTLRREFLAKPAQKAQTGSARVKPATGHVPRSEMIRKFAPHPQPIKPAVRPQTMPKLDITPTKPRVSPLVSQKHALVTNQTVVPSRPVPSSVSAREALIAERMATANTTGQTHDTKTKSSRNTKRPRIMSMATVSLALIVLVGYFTYLNMPGLSVRVAAAQADIAASYPDYHPDGYSFNGPVAYASGQVAINFAANGGTSKYTVTQQKSSWDSQAVYDNVVAKAADDSYVTNSQQGLMIYTFKGDAAWVNKGILYTISGDAPLSNEQLLRIAGSL